MSKAPEHAVEPPWVLLSAKPAPKNVELLWCDLEGSPHLGVQKGDDVFLTTYGNAPEVRRDLADFLCYQKIKLPKIFEI